MSQSHHARRILTPGASRKRKEMDRHGPQSINITSSSTKPSIPQTSVSVNVNGTKEAVEPPSSNRLLAGYMAYEFITKGTLLGERFDPARAVAVPLKSTTEQRRNGGKPASYAEVASLLKGEKAQVPGVVNPTQLARWLQM